MHAHTQTSPISFWTLECGKHLPAERPQPNFGLVNKAVVPKTLSNFQGRLEPDSCYHMSDCTESPLINANRKPSILEQMSSRLHQRNDMPSLSLLHNTPLWYNRLPALCRAIWSSGILISTSGVGKAEEEKALEVEDERRINLQKCKCNKCGSACTFRQIMFSQI